jgi:L-aminopeptidase/D-esterase-like protein
MLVPGFKIGHATNAKYHTGCTVILCPEGAVAGVDVRGPGPGTRETALLSPDKTLHKVNGVVFAGGSAFGLAAADGVVRFLAEGGYGHFTPVRPVPIVTAAVVYDLFLSGGEALPDAEMGYIASVHAHEGEPEQGNIGAGTGVAVGKWAGHDYLMKGGFGFSSLTVDDLIVNAASVTNSIGDIVTADGSVLAGAREENGSWLVEKWPLRHVPSAAPPLTGTHTTLVAVMTNAKMSQVEANRLAQRAHDGLAIAVRPAHMTHEGDTTFALATDEVDVPFELVASAAVEVVTEAIRNAVREAEPVGSIPGLKKD